MQSGGVKCWGFNIYGQVGNATWGNQSWPVDVANLPAPVVQIATGPGDYWNSHTCAVTVAGAAVCWGANPWGELGDGLAPYNRNQATPVWGLSTGVSQIVVSDRHTCAIVSGSAECWGYGPLVGNGAASNQTTPISVPGLNTGVTQLAASLNHTCAVVSGHVMCWGVNTDGKLGDGTTNDSPTPVTVAGIDTATGVVAGTDYSCAWLVGGVIKCWGQGYGLVPVQPSDLGGAVFIAPGAYHSCALFSNRRVKCWGSNGFGELGDGTTTPRPEPVDVVGLNWPVVAVAAGEYHTCVLTDVSSVMCWGSDNGGGLGIGGGSGSVLTPVVALTGNPLAVFLPFVRS
jgi:alpha-tubulin suppressor-like RCC1 family protein